LRVIVCGTRGYASPHHKYLLEEELKQWWPIDEIIHGDCRNSADQLAGQIAHEKDITEWAYPADWTKHGKAAGYIRNVEMAAIENVDQCVAIWDGVSKGTEHMIRIATQCGIPVNIIPATM
jgi:hypothetical protein